ncbi:MAG: Gx transporter family protein [Ruminococcaceae bacterium]|nr:Gx transporter family protein [Oscillospiraceae bacterium]
MPLRTKTMNAHKITTAGLLVSCGLVLHYAESLIPIFQVIPGGKLGLANVVTLLAFSWYDAGFALLVGLLRCFLSSLFSGTLTMMLYSGAGTLFSIMVMTCLKQFFSKQISTVGRSMLGAFFFNVGQTVVCAVVLENVLIFSYLPVLTILAAVCGLLTGIAAKQTEHIILSHRRR